MLDYKFIIPDPVHKTIPITAIEKELLRSPPLRRLLQIKQMALTYMVFPGAIHTRYEHSLGVMHIAGQLGNCLLPEIDEASIQKLRIAGLLHDVGHPPLSHAVEKFLIRNLHFVPDHFKDKYSHEAFTSEIIQTDETLQTILTRRPVAYNLQEIADLATGKSSQGWGKIISGELDADRIDYILRDLYHSGVGIQNVNLQELYSSLCFIPQYKTDIGFKKNGITSLESVLISRFHLISSVQNHPDNMILTRKLTEALEQSFDNYKKKKSLKAVNKLVIDLHKKWDDFDLLSFIEKYKKDESLNLLRGDEWKSVQSFSTFDIRPNLRYFFHKLAFHSNKIHTLEELLRDKLNYNEIYLEIARINPPTLWTKIEEPEVEKGYRYLKDYSPILRSLISASFQDLKIALISSQNFEITREKVWDLLSDLVLEVTKDLLSKEIIDLSDLVLISIHSIFEGLEKEGLSLNIWKGISALSGYILELLTSTSPELKLLSNNENITQKKMVIESSINFLISLGLLERSKIPIQFHGDNKFYNRFDIKISHWGSDTAWFLVRNGLKRLVDVQTNLIIKDLNNEEKDRQELEKMEINREKLSLELHMKGIPVFKDEEFLKLRDTLYNKRNELKLKLAK
ncbi:MAG: HD domain-containing protein [Candidatus Hodarchaeota archaeon]